MRIILNQCHDPAFNLALEEYALTQMDMDMVILWRNAKAVIIGNNQNAVEEINVDYVRENNIAVIRRQSGGGAVFHDLGNINYTVIHKLGENDFSNYAKFTAPICEYLQTLGVKAELKGRNDLLIDGMKFSGNAQAVKNGRIMHHGCILFNADVSDLAKSLVPKTEKIESKGIKSVRSRVTNVYSHLPVPMTAEEFYNGIADHFRKQDMEEYMLTKEDIAAIQKLVEEKYSQWEWNFGKSPAYNWENSRHYPFGIVDARLNVKDGVMEEVHIFGDFFGIQNKEALEQKLQGVRHDRQAIAQALDGVDLQQYIHGITLEDFLNLIF